MSEPTGITETLAHLRQINAPLVPFGELKLRAKFKLPGNDHISFTKVDDTRAVINKGSRTPYVCTSWRFGLAKEVVPQPEEAM